MDRQAIAHDLLERILLDENKDPTNFPIGLLESITNDFSSDQKIGSGGFADVYKGQLQSGIVAVKKLKQQSEMVETKFIQEVDSLMKVKHKNVVRFLGYCSDTQGKVWKHQGKNIMAEERQRFLCFEFLPEGSLDKHISDASSGLEWRTRYHIIKGICEGLHYLHGKKIVHSDLKPENILLDHNMVPKIGDFGLARSFHEEQTRTITQNVFGTPYYMAPESFRGVVSFESDIYSLGIIITEMLTGQKDDLSIETVHEKWTTRFKTSRGGTWLEHVRVCKEIGLECMDFDPKKRPTTGHIIDSLAKLEHKYGFIETDFDPKKRPTTGHIIDSLAKLEHKYGFIETDLPATHELDAYPLGIWFPFESDKVIKRPVTLTNKTDDLIGVWIAPTSLDACSNPGYPYVWDHLEHSKDDHKSSIFRSLGPHSSVTIYMTMRKQKQTLLEAADKGTFDVVMVATKSKEDLRLLQNYWDPRSTRRQIKLADLLRGAKEFGAVVHLATLRAAVTSDPARCQEVAAHQVIQTELDGEYIGYADVHPTKTWVLVGLSKHVSIWNYETQETVTKFEVKYLKERKYFNDITSIKFITGEQWFAVGDCKGRVHVYAYSSFGAEKDKVKEFKAVGGTVTDMAVYPKHTLLLTADAYNEKVSLWDWSQDWTCARVIDTHCRTTIKGGPSTFASLREPVEVWDIHSPDGIAATFEGSGPAFGTDGHRNFLATFDTDTYTTRIAKIWDLQTKKHVHTLCSEILPWGLRCLACHRTLPILAGMITGSDVQQILFWDVRTYRLMKRVELHIKGGFREMLFDGSEDITSLVVASERQISIIKINVPMLLTGY